MLNGNGVAGSASNASYLLGQKGYATVTPPSGQPANAPNWNYFHSKVYFDPARKNGMGPSRRSRSRASSAAPTSSRCRRTSGRSRTARC